MVTDSNIISAELEKNLINKNLNYMRTLNVKKVTKNEIEQKWGYQLPIMWGNTLYMRCNAKGEINWEKAPVYQPNELVERGNYAVH